MNQKCHFSDEIVPFLGFSFLFVEYQILPELSGSLVHLIEVKKELTNRINQG